MSPGNAYTNVSPPIVSTLNLADMMRLSAVRERQCGLQGDCAEAWLFAGSPARLVPADRT